MTPTPSGEMIREVERARRRLRTRRALVKIPDLVGLHRQRPGMYFHSWPELFIQTGGATDFECPSGAFRLSTGNIAVMPAGVPHSEVPVDLATPYGTLVFLQIADDCLVLRARADGLRRIFPTGSVRVPGGNIFLNLLEQAPLSRGIPGAYGSEFNAGLVDAFLTAMVSGLKNPAPAGAVAVPHLVGEAEKRVRLDLSDPGLTVAGIARSLGCSADHLTRVFRAARGMTPSVWIARERVQLACDLLEGSPHNVSEIGWTCGFRTPSYFIRVFRTHTGMTPRAWRERPSKGVRS